MDDLCSLVRGSTEDPQQRAQWLVCEGTWFIGVDALPNGTDGILNGVQLKGQAIEFAQSLFGSLTLHKAQVSVVCSVVKEMLPWDSME